MSDKFFSWAGVQVVYVDLLTKEREELVLRRKTKLGLDTDDLDALRVA